jgi:hypothetical protein
MALAATGIPFSEFNAAAPNDMLEGRATGETTPAEVTKRPYWMDRFCLTNALTAV